MGVALLSHQYEFILTEPFPILENPHINHLHMEERCYKRLCEWLDQDRARILAAMIVEYRVKPEAIRRLYAIARRNPALLCDRSDRVIDRLKQGTLEPVKQRERKFEPPQGQECPSCRNFTYFVIFAKRSTGPGSKCEDTRIGKCGCGFMD